MSSYDLLLKKYRDKIHFLTQELDNMKRINGELKESVERWKAWHESVCRDLSLQADSPEVRALADDVTNRYGRMKNPMPWQKELLEIAQKIILRR